MTFNRTFKNCIDLCSKHYVTQVLRNHNSCICIYFLWWLLVHCVLLLGLTGALLLNLCALSYADRSRLCQQKNIDNLFRSESSVPHILHSSLTFSRLANVTHPIERISVFILSNSNHLISNPCINNSSVVIQVEITIPSSRFFKSFVSLTCGRALAKLIVSCDLNNSSASLFHYI